MTSPIAQRSAIGRSAQTRIRELEETVSGLTKRLQEAEIQKAEVRRRLAQNERAAAEGQKMVSQVSLLHAQLDAERVRSNNAEREAVERATELAQLRETWSRSVDDWKSTQEHMSEENERLKGCIEDLYKQVKDLDASNKAWERSHDVVRQQATKYEEQFHESASTLAFHIEACETANRELAAARSCNADLRHTVDLLENRVAECNAVIETLKREKRQVVESLQSHREQSHTEEQRLQQNMQQLRTHLASATKSSSEWNQRSTELEGTLLDTQRRLAHAESDAKLRTAECEGLQEKLLLICEEKDELAEQLTRAKNESSTRAATVAALEVALTEAKRTAQQAVAASAAEVQLQLKSQGQISELRALVARLETELETVQSQNSSRGEKLERLATSHTAMEADLRSMREAFETASAAREACEVQLAQRDTSLVTLQKQVEALHAQLRQATDSLLEEKNKDEQHSVALHEQLATKEAQVASAEAKAMVCESSLVQMKQKHAAIKKELEMQMISYFELEAKYDEAVVQRLTLERNQEETAAASEARMSALAASCASVQNYFTRYEDQHRRCIKRESEALFWHLKAEQRLDVHRINTKVIARRVDEQTRRVDKLQSRFKGLRNIFEKNGSEDPRIIEALSLLSLYCTELDSAKATLTRELAPPIAFSAMEPNTASGGVLEVGRSHGQLTPPLSPVPAAKRQRDENDGVPLGSSARPPLRYYRRET